MQDDFLLRVPLLLALAVAAILIVVRRSQLPPGAAGLGLGGLAVLAAANLVPLAYGKYAWDDTVDGWLGWYNGPQSTAVSYSVIGLGYVTAVLLIVGGVVKALRPAPAGHPAAAPWEAPGGYGPHPFPPLPGPPAPGPGQFAPPPPGPPQFGPLAPSQPFPAPYRPPLEPPAR